MKVVGKLINPHIMSLHIIPACPFECKHTVMWGQGATVVLTKTIQLNLKLCVSKGGRNHTGD